MTWHCRIFSKTIKEYSYKQIIRISKSTPKNSQLDPDYLVFMPLTQRQNLITLEDMEDARAEEIEV